MKSSPLWLPWTICFGFLPFSLVFPFQSVWWLHCSAESLKAGGFSYHLWADTLHIHVYSPVPSPPLMSSTSDYFLDTLLGVSQTHQTQDVYNGADHLLVPNSCSSSCKSSSVASSPGDTQDKPETWNHPWLLPPELITISWQLHPLFPVSPFLCTDQMALVQPSIFSHSDIFASNLVFLEKLSSTQALDWTFWSSNVLLLPSRFTSFRDSPSHSRYSHAPLCDIHVCVAPFQEYVFLENADWLKWAKWWDWEYETQKTGE